MEIAAKTAHKPAKPLKVQKGCDGRAEQRPGDAAEAGQQQRLDEELRGNGPHLTPPRSPRPAWPH
jgi:hypothetical protein